MKIQFCNFKRTNNQFVLESDNTNIVLNSYKYSKEQILKRKMTILEVYEANSASK
jgi:hypothetical protein